MAYLVDEVSLKLIPIAKYVPLQFKCYYLFLLTWACLPTRFEFSITRVTGRDLWSNGIITISVGITWMAISTTVTASKTSLLRVDRWQMDSHRYFEIILTSEWETFWHTDWLIASLIVWVTDWVKHTDGLNDCPTFWQTERLTDGQKDRQTDRRMDWLVAWHTEEQEPWALY